MIDRRAFLKQGALSGALLTSPYLARTAFGADDLGGDEEKPNLDLSDVTIRYGTTTPLQEVRLRSSKQLDSLPFKIEIANFVSSYVALEALNAGAIDIFSGGASNILAIAARPGRSLVVTTMHSAFYGSILVHPNSKITSVADIKGKKLGVAKGTGTDYRAAQQIAVSNVAWSDIQVINLAPSDAQAALVGGSIDVWAVVDPQAALAVTSSRARELVGLTLPNYFYCCGSVAAMSDLKKRAALVRLILRDLRSYKWVRDNMEEWTRLQSGPLKVDETVSKFVSSRLPKDGGLFKVTSEEIIKDAEQTAEFSLATGLISSKANVKPVFYTGFNDWLKARAPGL